MHDQLLLYVLPLFTVTNLVNNSVITNSRKISIKSEIMVTPIPNHVIGVHMVNLILEISLTLMRPNMEERNILAINFVIFVLN